MIPAPPTGPRPPAAAGAGAPEGAAGAAGGGVEAEREPVAQLGDGPALAAEAVGDVAAVDHLEPARALVELADRRQRRHVGVAAAVDGPHALDALDEAHERAVQDAAEVDPAPVPAVARGDVDDLGVPAAERRLHLLDVVAADRVVVVEPRGDHVRRAGAEARPHGLADPLGTPPTTPDLKQLQLDFQGFGQSSA